MASGDHDWTAGEIVTAANVDDYLMLQAKQEYATSAARDSALTTRKREGTLTHQADANSLTIYSGSAWSTVGPVHGALTAWTPTVSQTGGVALTVNYATYERVGRMIHAWWVLTCTGSGTAASAVVVSLPVNMLGAAITAYAHLGAGSVWDNSANTRYPGLVVPSAAGSVTYYPCEVSGVGTAALGAQVFTAALAVGDIIGGYAVYEAAADA